MLGLTRWQRRDVQRIRRRGWPSLRDGRYLETVTFVNLHDGGIVGTIGGQHVGTSPSKESDSLSLSLGILGPDFLSALPGLQKEKA